MKRFIAALVAVAALLTGAVAVTAPAQAAPDCWGMTCWSPAVAQNAPGECNYIPALPTDVSGCKFYTGKTLCVDGSGINGAYYRVAVIAQAWNNAVGSPNTLALDYSDDCAADGYPPSRRMVIDGFYGPNNGICTTYTNTGRTIGTSSFDWWTQGPGAYIDFNSSCVAGQAARDKTVSMAIGRHLGLTVLTSSGFTSRVMYNGSYAVTMPDANSGATLYKIYTGQLG